MRLELGEVPRPVCPQQRRKRDLWLRSRFVILILAASRLQLDCRICRYAVAPYESVLAFYRRVHGPQASLPTSTTNAFRH